jgi:hypothetical protein
MVILKLRCMEALGPTNMVMYDGRVERKRKWVEGGGKSAFGGR